MTEHYEAPKLAEVGKVGDLTQGGGGEQQDATGSATIIEPVK